MATKEITDDTLLSEYLESPEAVHALSSRKLMTVGDLKTRTLPEIAAIPAIGERTIEQIKALRVVADRKPSNFAEIAENNNPIHLRSPYANFAIQVMPGDAIESGARGLRRIPPLYVMFKNGRGELNRKEWFFRVYKRDMTMVEEAMKNNLPWRKDAAKWLRENHKCGKDFSIMSD